MIRKIRAVIPNPKNWADDEGQAFRFWVFSDSGEYCEIRLTTSDFESYNDTLTVAWQPVSAGSINNWPTLAGHQVMAVLPVPGNLNSYTFGARNEFWVFDNAGQVCRIQLQIGKDGSVTDSFTLGGAWHSTARWHSLESHQVATFISSHSMEVDERFARPTFPFDEYYMFDVEGKVAELRIARGDYRDENTSGWRNATGTSISGHKIISSIPVPGNIARVSKTRSAQHWFFDDAGNVRRLKIAFAGDGSIESISPIGEWHDATRDWPSLALPAPVLHIPAPVITVPAGDGTYIVQGGEISGTAEIADDANAVVKIFEGNNEVSQEPAMKVVGKRWTVRLTKTIPTGGHSLSAYVYVGKDYGPASDVRKVSVVALPAPVISVPAENATVSQGALISGTAEVPNEWQAVVKVYKEGLEGEVTADAVIKDGRWETHLLSRSGTGNHQLSAYVFLGTDYGNPSPTRRITVVALPKPVITVPAGDGTYIVQGGEISGTAEIADDANAVVKIFEGNNEVS
ncbi:hypothetical protein ACGFYF_42270, partial [Streptomyces lavendulae]|uniref:hypothetical protein n=1 Tax=Streptomyces lavendulae TaxID=1914 RepID=UPI0037172C27